MNAMTEVQLEISTSSCYEGQIDYYWDLFPISRKDRRHFQIVQGAYGIHGRYKTLRGVRRGAARWAKKHNMKIVKTFVNQPWHEPICLEHVD